MTIDKRKLLGPLFPICSRIKHSDFARLLIGTAWLPSQVLRARHNRPFFAVNMGTLKGMGALISEAILICNYAEQNSLTPIITSTNPLYASEKGRDFLSTYFCSGEHQPKRPLRPMHFETIRSFYHLNFAQHITLRVANRIFWEYFRPKAIITDKVNAILSNVHGRKFDLSIHYRGTDKVREAPLPAFETFNHAINFQVRAGLPICTVFLATDDVQFERFIKQCFPNIHFVTYNLGTPTDTSRGRHFSDMSPTDKAIESLVNMFLLASAARCIRGPSYMSAICKIINNDLQTITLGRTHLGSNLFPEKEIALESSEFDPSAPHPPQLAASPR